MGKGSTIALKTPREFNFYLNCLFQKRREELCLVIIYLSTISTGKLNTLQCLHCPPINLVIYKGFHPYYYGMRSNLGGCFPLRCFQRLSVGNIATQQCSYSETTGTPGIPSSQSSRTRDDSPQISTVIQDRDRAVLRRSEPSSRTALMGEQPNPWELLHPQDAMHVNSIITNGIDYTFIPHSA